MATALQHIESHWNSTVIPSILEQYKDSEKWQAMLKAVIDQMQIAEDAAAEFMTVLDFRSEVPTGDRLDFIAGLVNVTRMAGESDELFYTRFIASLGSHTAGTPDNVIYNAALLSGDSAPQYMDEAPATFFVYTGPRKDASQTEAPYTADGGADQLTRAQVQKTAPAGVLGLPGAAIQFADLSLMGDAQGRLVLATADDSNVERSLVLSDNLGAVIVGGSNKPVKAVLKGGASVQTHSAVIGGTEVRTVRIKDLPDAVDEDGYMVRDSETEGTTKKLENDIGLKMRSSGTNTLRFYRGARQEDTEE